MGLQESIEQLTEIAERRDEAHYGFIKQVLLMASSLFGIIVALHKQTPKADHTIHLVFSITLILLSLGILFLTIALFAEVSLHRKIWNSWKNEVLEQLSDPMYRPKFVAEEPSKFFVFVEKVSYVSLLLSIICLAIYGILNF